MKGINLIPLFACLFLGVTAQCPSTIKAPCSCKSTRYEPVSIHCDRADSLESVLRALSNPPQFIDSLTISNTPIEELPAGLFAGVSIRHLTFQNNGLRSIQKGAFSGNLVDSIEELEIRTNMLETIPEEGLSELKSLDSLIITDNNIQNISALTFLKYYSRTRLQKLDLSANKISYIPAEGLLGLENLHTLILDKNMFTTIPTEALENVQTLEDLSLSINKISVIETKALPLRNLKSLGLEVNQIEMINPNVFRETPELLYLYLSNNRFSVIDPKMFLHIEKLKVLAMSYNVGLRMIPFNAFQYTPSLIRLEMTDCSIGTVEEGAFRKTPKIQVISLARNKLKRIGKLLLNTLTYAQSLDFKQNEIVTVDDYAFCKLEMLQKLDLSSNKLQSLPANVFFEAPEKAFKTSLKVLYLNDNLWKCDEKILWLINWLNQNPAIKITSPDTTLQTRCTSPSDVSGVPLRHAGSMIHIPPPPIMPKEHITNNNIAPMTKRGEEEFEEQAISVVNPLGTIFIIIAIVLLFLLIAISLIFLTYYFVRRRERKKMPPSVTSSEQDNYAVDPSVVSGLASIYGSTNMLNCDARSARLPRFQPYDNNDPALYAQSSNWWF
uniref:LRRCT domain-containing protein n=1 Tax=Panagrellus redivivus TaxID=6233 RepID=A0A7E4VLQ5_PANRE